MDIVFIGDSLTFGYGVSRENSWVNLLVKNYTFTYLNKGVNGDTTIGMLSRFFNDVVNIKPKYCFILGGTNDLLSGKNITSVYENILLMIKDCIENRIIPIILSPSYISEKEATSRWSSYPDYSEINENLLTLNNKLNFYCQKKNLLFVDLFNTTNTAFLNNEDIYIDGIHFNNSGHNLIYTTVNQTFRNIAKKSN